MVLIPEGNKTSGGKTRIAVSCVATYVVAIMAGWLQPAIIEGLRDGMNLSRAAAGIVAGAEVATVGIGSMLIGTKLHVIGLSLRTLGLLACFLIVAGSLLSILTGRLEILLLGRLIAGAGQACAFATATNVLASRIDPLRIGRVIAAYTFSEGLILLAVPHLLEPYAHRSVFALMGSLGLVFAPIIALLPNERPEGRNSQAGSIHSRGGWLLFAGSAVWATIMGMIWAFSFEIGKATGLALQTLGIVGSPVRG